MKSHVDREAELKTNLTKALKAAYRDTIKLLQNKGEEEIKAMVKSLGINVDDITIEGCQYTVLDRALSKVVQQEVNKYLGNKGLPCVLDHELVRRFQSGYYREGEPRSQVYQSLGEKLSLGAPKSGNDIDRAAYDLLSKCEGIFKPLESLTNAMHYELINRNFDKEINYCVMGIMKNVAKFVLSAGLFYGAAVAGMSYTSGAALALGTLTIPPMGIAVVGALALAAGAYTLSGVVQGLFLGRTVELYEDTVHIPGLFKQLATARAGISDETSGEIDKSSTKMAEAAVKVAKDLEIYCSKFEQKGQGASI